MPRVGSGHIFPEHNADTSLHSTHQYDHAHISSLAKRLKDRVLSEIDAVLVNGDVDGYPGCVNLSFQYVEGESLLMALKDVCLSSGSACTSASLEPSYVLRALGLDDENVSCDVSPSSCIGIDSLTLLSPLPTCRPTHRSASVSVVSPQKQRLIT